MSESGFRVWSLGGMPIVAAPAEIDVANAGLLRDALTTADSGAHPAVVVDLSETVFCDSTALSVLVTAWKRASAGGRELRLVINKSSLLRILSVTGMDKLLTIFDSLPEALAVRPPAARPVFRPRHASTVARPAS